MEFKAILLLISFTILLIYVEILIYVSSVKPLYKKQNEYKQIECKISNKNYIKESKKQSFLHNVGLTKNEIYVINYDIEIKGSLKKCEKVKYCNNPLTSKICLEDIMNEDNEKKCYYNKNDEDICHHLSKNGHFTNLILIFCSCLIMFIVSYCYVIISMTIYEIFSDSVILNKRRGYIEIV